MQLLRTPNELTSEEILDTGCSWSPAMYSRVVISARNCPLVGNLLDAENPFDKGVEPGSRAYVKASDCLFIRTKALRESSFLLQNKGDAIVPLNPQAFRDPGLTHGEILLSKDSNIGQCAMVDGTFWSNAMFSSGIVRLHPVVDPFYLFAFLKHSVFRLELAGMIPRGATIAHAGDTWLRCRVPFPDADSEQTVRYIAALAEAVFDKERAIARRARAVLETIQDELVSNQKDAAFSFSYPTIAQLRSSGRLDAAIHDVEFKAKSWLVSNYAHGWTTPSEAGFKVTPGPSLEMKILRTRIDSATPKPGFYALILPTNITPNGTLSSVTYLGTKKKLPLLHQGDIVFGESGFHKGRSLVLLDGIENCTTNAHGLCATRSDGDLDKSVYFRCVLNWYRYRGLIDLMAVGGSGGHFSPEYFDYLRIPNCPPEVQGDIARLYNNPGSTPERRLTLENMVQWHREWNETLGVWQLDREMRRLREELVAAQDAVIDGRSVQMPFA